MLGVNDGLVTNICLILGLAGAHLSSGDVRLAGIASLLAGAFSMAAGEWVSVQSQAELYDGLLAEVRRLVARNPGLVLDELARHLEQAGLARATAQTAASDLTLDEDRFFSFSARTLFGINPAGLGSPITSAVTSLAYFAMGAFVPLLPWFFLHGTAAAVTSFVLTAAASLMVGGVVARSSDRSILHGAFRQLGISICAAGVTFGIGRLIGTTVA